MAKDSFKNTLSGLSYRDQRDGHSYTLITLGQRLWTAENLRYYSAFGTFGLRNCNSNIRDYGGYYTWNDADEACPPGWKIPTVDEWHELYSTWKRKFQDLDFVKFASGSVIEEFGTLPMGGIGRLEDGLYNDATFTDVNTAAYFWAKSDGSFYGLKIFSITADGVKTFNPIGNEVCNLRVVKSFEKSPKDNANN